MAQHFTKNTLETTRWCNTCGCLTQWDVWSGRLGRCKNEHHHPKEQNPSPTENKQASLFESQGGK